MKESTQRKWSYLLIGKGFFADMYNGQASHAVGCIQGLLGCSDLLIDLYSDINPKIQDSRVKFFDLGKYTNFISRIMSMHKVLSSLHCDDSVNVIHIRKNWLFQVYIILYSKFFKILCEKRNVVIEINGLGFVDKKWIPTRFLSWIYDKLLVTFLNRNLVVYTVNPNLTSRLLSLKNSLKVVTVPNGSPAPQSVRKYNPNKVAVVFFGHLQPYNDFEFLCRLSKSFHRVFIIGGGPCSEEVDKIARNYSNVSRIGAISLLNVDKMLSDPAYAYFGIVPVKPSTMNSYLSPVKLYDYSSIGLPILVSSNVVLTDDQKGGHILTYDDESDIQRLVQPFIAQERLYEYYSELAIKFAVANSWEARMRSLLAVACKN